MRSRLLLIAVGGVLGSAARYGIALALGHEPGSWPWDTLIANLAGALAIGVLSPLARRWWDGPLLIIGFLGGFTTFSAFALETGLLLDSGDVGLAAVYVLVTMAGGLTAVRVGARLVGRRSAA